MYSITYLFEIDSILDIFLQNLWLTEPDVGVTAAPNGGKKNNKKINNSLAKEGFQAVLVCTFSLISMT